MLSVDQAIDRLGSAASLLVSPENVPLAQALGRVLAEDVRSAIDVPPADNSAMDGYALRAGDWPGPGEAMPVCQRIAAGSQPRALEPGTAARIFTGAEVPAGADTVVMQENTEARGEEGVCILKLPDAGANIRRRGQDIACGDVVLRQGIRLRPQDLAQLAAVGSADARSFRRLRVAILSSGDELVEPGDDSGPGKIFNSNRFSIAGLLQCWGHEAVDLGIVSDTFRATRDALLEGDRRADVIITSGGVSVGEEDHVRAVVEELGAVELWKVAIKPGKPFTFGRVGGTPLLGLPGNPVSVFVTLLVLARPFLAGCQGEVLRPTLPLPARATFDKPGDSREDYLRVRLRGDGLELFRSQSSGVLSSLVWSDGLVRQRPGQDIRAGDTVDYFPFERMF